MKRALILLVVLLIAFLAARRSGFFSQFSSAGSNNSTATAPTLVKGQTFVTSLPPLSNVVFRPKRSTNPKPKASPPQTETPDSSIAPDQSTNELAQNVARTAAQLESGNSTLRDPLARVALSLVGADATAEQYWAAAINDPSLSAKEREDLIEDLNEVGFADPQNPTPDEIPLIVNRLQIIEQYAPFAMDDNNARSFAEAYKDLSGMLARLTAQ
jgi:hypothetical protein